MRRALLPALAALALGGLAVADDVYVREVDRATGKDKEVSYAGVIAAETPAGITLKEKGKDRLIPARDVLRITYTVKGLDAAEMRKPDFLFEDKARKEKDAQKRLPLYEDALKEYKALEVKLKKTAPNVSRYLQYRMALVHVAIGRDDPAKMKAAIKALADYKTDFNDGWEIVPALELLAHLQEKDGDLEGARRALEQLTIVPDVPADVKSTSVILVAQMLLRKKTPEAAAAAEAKLIAGLAPLKPDDPQRLRLTAFLVQAQMAQNKLDAAKAELDKVARADVEPAVKALTHNLLGDYYRLKKQDEEAFWHYLRVHVMYPQDRAEHAKALYYLSDLFDSVKKDPQKGNACHDRLLEKDFEGTEYQDMAKAKKPTG
jgi:hypothetical protein